MKDVEFGPVAVGQGARELQDLRVERGVLRGEVRLDVEEVRLVRGRGGVDRREDLREGPIPVAGLHEPDRAGAGAEQVHVGRAEEHALVRLGLLHQQVVPAPQHLPDHLDVAPTPEDVRGDGHAVLTERLGELFEDLGPLPDDERLEFLRVREHQPGVPGEVFDHRDQLDRGPVLLRQSGGAGKRTVRGVVAIDRDEDVPEPIHRLSSLLKDGPDLPREMRRGRPGDSRETQVLRGADVPWTPAPSSRRLTISTTATGAREQATMTAHSDGRRRDGMEHPPEQRHGDRGRPGGGRRRARPPTASRS